MQEDKDEISGIPLPLSNPGFGYFFEQNRRIVAALSRFDPAQLIPVIGGLLTVPDWQASTLRLEILQHLAVASASGTKRPKAADLKSWLTELGNGIAGRMEDPSEDVFVSRVILPDRDYLIFEGIYESSAFHLQRFVNVLERMPEREPFAASGDLHAPCFASGPTGRPRGDLRWSTFLRTHAQGMLACDFFVTVTASFRLLYVFVIIEHGSRRLLHLNVTGHPSAAWTLQQLREAVGLESRHRFLLHDRDSIFSAELDRSISALGITVLKSAPRTPRMNAVCERVIGTIRRECLDWVIPLSEAHLRTILRSWVKHYNRGWPHMGLGPGIPDAPLTLIAKSTSRHRRGHSYVVRANPILGGLHHEYTLVAA